MPPSKGPAERGYTLQAQEQGTGTTPHRRGDSQGARQASPSGKERRGTGASRGGPGAVASTAWRPLCWGTPGGRVTPPLHGEGDCSSQTMDVTVRPGRAAAESPMAKPPWGSGSRDGTRGTGGRAPQQPHPHRRGGTTPGGVLARTPFCHQKTESTGVQLVPDHFSSVLRGKCFLPVLYFTSCCLLVGGSSFHTRPQTWRSLPFSPRCHFPGD